MRVNGVAYRTVWWDAGAVKLIDQRRLPFRFEILSLRSPGEVAEAIREMAVRGAGAIGVAAGFAIAQAAAQAPVERFDEAIAQAAGVIRATRPTARNLFYAVERVLASTAERKSVEDKRAGALAAAQTLADQDAASCERIGVIGQQLLGDSTTVLTHCNAGWLAFADWGSALAPMYKAHRDGKRVAVVATETRPRGQGAKLTVWELAQEGVPHTLIPDTAAGAVMRQGLVDLVLVGADRIAANGDVANKIGTYTLAVLARAHRIPFYVAAPTSTVDLACPTGEAIPIEERAGEEVTWTVGETAAGTLERVRTAHAGSAVRNWAFDVTPAEYITGLLTERGLIRTEPQAIRELMRTPAPSTRLTR
ncbi:MAG: S-methyl-5-thioribose-1-phosphate isomerase [Omnitrophica bacterium RIFCSPHIGHO2_02_FULL_63_14]|nr:MAG: S-methyl-5-thioribose-1-phosphate isomerase [Omnitrophica bacterium RIFCSPHIGHO2_02_FULL_63_14]